MGRKSFSLIIFLCLIFLSGIEGNCKTFKQSQDLQILSIFKCKGNNLCGYVRNNGITSYYNLNLEIVTVTSSKNPKIIETHTLSRYKLKPNDIWSFKEPLNSTKKFEVFVVKSFLYSDHSFR